MNILVIGHSVLDFIKENGTHKVQAGGIVYSVLGLLSQLDENDTIYLLSSGDSETEPYFSPYYKMINRNLISRVDKIPRVHLVSSESGERCENYENITDTLNLSVIEDVNYFDAILINMITGFDIKKDDLVALRKSFRGPVFLDVHTLSRGLSKEGKREFRKIPDAGSWLGCVDILQSNENELKTFGDFPDEISAAGLILNSGPELLIVTKGRKGVAVYHRENGQIRKIERDACEVHTVNRIGCGDVFGAVFFYGYLKNKSLVNILDLANKAAALSTTYKSINEFKQLKDDINKRSY